MGGNNAWFENKYIRASVAINVAAMESARFFVKRKIGFDDKINCSGDENNMKVKCT